MAGRAFGPHNEPEDNAVLPYVNDAGLAVPTDQLDETLDESGLKETILLLKSPA